MMPRAHRASPGAAPGRSGTRLVLLAAGLALLASCSLVPDIRLPGSARPSASPRPTPIADRAIDLDGLCAQTEEDGFRENARLLVRDNKVQALSWDIAVGRKGTCHFSLDGFRQTQARPHIELVARDGSGCKLLVWQDPRRVTLAHVNCASRCTPRGIDDQAWPALFEPTTGRCARNL